MKQSTHRILTTHTGSLPRPKDLVTLLHAKDQGQEPDPAIFAARVRSVTAELVHQQLACQVDVVNDGEAGKVGYSTYVKDRLTGFDGSASPLAIADLAVFPRYSERLFRGTPIESMLRPACTGPVVYKNKAAVSPRSGCGSSSALFGPRVITMVISPKIFPRAITALRLIR